MSNRARVVLVRCRDRVPSHRLRGLSDGYDAACEAMLIAADLGVSGDVYDALWDLCERWRGKAESKNKVIQGVSA